MTTTAFAHEQKLLFAHAPELHDANMRGEFYRAFLRAGREYGFSEQEMQGICDHRVMLLIRDAAIHLGIYKPVWEAAE